MKRKIISFVLLQAWLSYKVKQIKILLAGFFPQQSTTQCHVTSDNKTVYKSLSVVLSVQYTCNI